jgi:UPF0755 protein
MGRYLVRLVLFLILLGVAVAGAAFWGYREFTGPGPLAEESAIVIPRGAGVNAVARLLAEHGVVRSQVLFKLGAEVLGASRALRAGEYAFPARVSAREAIDIIRSGKVLVHRLTVPEGLTTAEVLALLHAEEALEGEVALSVGEGALLPETYHFVRGDAREEIVRRMQRAMDETVASLWSGRDPDLPYTTPREAVVLASIIEEETSVDSERELVSAVFVNRLRKGMRLQSDPTVIYGITDGKGPLGRELTKADLEADTPYNTYKTNGLPPGPIANPGRASIAAALRPAAADFLYFVADGNGGHAFARTLEEHNENVESWRALVKSRNGEAEPPP